LPWYIKIEKGRANKKEVKNRAKKKLREKERTSSLFYCYRTGKTNRSN